MAATPDMPVPYEAQTPLTRFFVGRRSEVRAGWRLVLYIVMVLVLSRVLLFAARAIPALGRALQGAPGLLTPGPQILQEAIQLAIVLVPAVVMGRLERRSLADYGLPGRGAFGKHFWIGMLWGLCLISAVIGGIALFRGYDISGLALSAGAIVEYGLLWLVGFTLVGFFEEFTFRGYTQFTLASGVGFWPAAVILSAAFGGAHLFNPGEGLVGALQVFLIAMFFCLTLRRTGTLWFAIGVHAAFDWGETFLYSVPNSGLRAAGHLFASSLHGAPWLTGGSVGPEGSVICFVLVALSILLFARLYPRARA